MATLNPVSTQRRNYRPIGARLLVFKVTERTRTHSGLYLGNTRRGTMSNVQRAWVLSTGARCMHKWQRGQCVIAIDGFEFEPLPINIWHEYCDAPEFVQLKKLQDATECEVAVSMLYEGSIIADDENYRATAEEEIETVYSPSHYA